MLSLSFIVDLGKLKIEGMVVLPWREVRYHLLRAGLSSKFCLFS